MTWQQLIDRGGLVTWTLNGKSVYGRVIRDKTGRIYLLHNELSRSGAQPAAGTEKGGYAHSYWFSEEGRKGDKSVPPEIQPYPVLPGFPPAPVKEPFRVAVTKENDMMVVRFHNFPYNLRGDGHLTTIEDVVFTSRSHPAMSIDLDDVEAEDDLETGDAYMVVYLPGRETSNDLMGVRFDSTTWVANCLDYVFGELTLWINAHATEHVEQEVKQPEAPAVPTPVVVKKAVLEDRSKMKVKPASVKKIMETELDKFNKLVSDERAAFDDKLKELLADRLSAKPKMTPPNVSRLNELSVTAAASIFTGIIQRCDLASEEQVELNDLLSGQYMPNLTAENLLKGINRQTVTVSVS